MIDTERLIRYAGECGVDLSPEAAEKCDLYAEKLIEENRRTNLTAVTDPEEALVKHFLDSICVAAYFPKDDATLIDVGSGAGFPGVPLALCLPNIRPTLLDARKKRIEFLSRLCAALSLSATLLPIRAEEGGRRRDLREKFDVAVARAVAPLPTLCEYCLPFVKPGGRFFALKGPNADRECEEAKRVMEVLGGALTEVVSLSLPVDPAYRGEKIERRILTIDKISPTPPEYPRSSAKIAKKPLSAPLKRKTVF